MISAAHRKLGKHGLAAAFLLVAAFAAALAVVWAAAGPAGAQEETQVPARPTGFTITTEPGSLDVGVDWDDVNGATHYLVRWRSVDNGEKLNQGVEVQSSEAAIAMADYGVWVARAQACNAAGCGKPANRQFRVEPAPEPTPTPEPTPAPTPEPTPEPPQTVPGRPTGLTITTQQGSLDASPDWDDVDGATEYLVRWRVAGPGNPLSDGIRPQSSSVTITVADYGDWVVRVEACNSAGCGRHLAQRFTVEPPPNRAPVVDEDAEQYDGFIASLNAPRGTTVHKGFAGIFSDPDGDELTYTVTVPDDRTDLVDLLSIPEGAEQVSIRLDVVGDWSAVTPALPDPLVTAVTLTATDPDGLSASLTGYFSTDWDSQPRLESAELGEETEAGDGAQGNSDGRSAAQGNSDDRKTARSRVAAAETARQSRSRTPACNGSTVAVTFDQNLRTNPAPTPAQFTVNFTNSDGSTGTIGVCGVSVNGNVLTLTLDSVVQDSQTLTLDYVHRDASPLKRGAVGGDSLDSFSNRPIRTSPLPVELVKQTAGTLVGNLGKWNGRADPFESWYRKDLAQGFTTGSHRHGYTLTEVNLRLSVSTGDEPNFSVSICPEASGKPSTPCLGTLTKPALTGTVHAGNVFKFSASDTGIDLVANTTYFVVVDTGPAEGFPRIIESKATNSDEEDAGAAAGWTIADNAWTRADRTGENTSSWSENSNAHLLSIVGTPIDPCLSYVELRNWNDIYADHVKQSHATRSTWANGCDSRSMSGHHARYFTFTLAAETPVRLEAEGANPINPRLFLRSGINSALHRQGAGTVLHEGSVYGNPLRSRIDETLSAGTYTLEVATDSRRGADFQFKLWAGTTPTLPTAAQLAGATTNIWQSDLRVQTVTRLTSKPEGCTPRFSPTFLCRDVLTSSAFTYNGVTYNINLILSEPSDLYVSLDAPYPPDASSWTLYLGGRAISFASANFRSGRTEAQWVGANLNLTPGTTVSIALAVPFECWVTIDRGETDASRWNSGCPSTENQGSYARYYTYTPTADGSITATLTSPDTEEEVFLYEDGTLVAQRSSSMYSSCYPRCASVYWPVKAGKNYVIEVTTDKPGRTGHYLLALRGSSAAKPSDYDPAGAEVSPPECRQTVQFGKQAGGDWTWPCYSVDRAGRYARYYTFTLGSASDVVVELYSPQVANTHMYLRQGTKGSGAAVLEAVDADAPVRTRITGNLPAGTYTVEAVATDIGAGGAFTLVIKSPPPKYTPAAHCVTDLGTIKPSSGKDRAGEWRSGSGCGSYTFGSGDARYYRFTLTGRGRILMELDSDAANSYLVLYEGRSFNKASLIAENDDSYLENSFIEATLGPGTYTAEATTNPYQNRRTGEYEFGLRRRE